MSAFERKMSANDPAMTARYEPAMRVEHARRLQLEGAPPDWLPPTAGIQLLGRRNGNLLLAAERNVDPERVLAAAEQTAKVISFNYGPPSLAELFLELVGR